MEVELKNIIEKIKTEGVEEGAKKAADIVQNAQQKAGETISDAEKNAKRIVEKAREEAEKLNKNAQVAIKQASRDAMLALKEDITNLFEKVIKREVAKQLSDDIIQKMLLILAEKFDKSGEKELEILLSEKDKKDLEETLLRKGKEEILKGVEFKVSSNVETGFLVGKKGENVYYDFTGEAVAEAFETFLNPKIAELLNNKK